MFRNTEFPKTLFPEFLSIHYSIKFSIPGLQDSRSKTFREWPHPISHPVSNQVQLSCILIYIYCNNSISIITLLSYCVSSLSPPTDSLTNVLQTTNYFYTVELFALDNTSAANQEVGRILETMLRLVGVFFPKLNFFKNSITFMLFVIMYLFLLVLECYSLVSVIKRYHKHIDTGNYFFFLKFISIMHACNAAFLQNFNQTYFLHSMNI